MKKSLVIVPVIVAISFYSGYWVKSQIVPNSGFSNRSTSSLGHPQKTLIKDIWEANNLTQDWINKNRNEIDPYASIIVTPIEDSGASIQWIGLSDKQFDEVSEIVYNYVDKVIEANKMKANKSQ